METECILSDYLERAMEVAVYDKLDDGTFAGRIPPCKGVLAFGTTLRECERLLRSTLEDWLLLGLRLGHTLPVLSGINLNKEPIRESKEKIVRYVFIILCLIACAAERQPGDLFGSVEEGSALVVDGILLVDQTLPELFVRRTLPPGQFYSQDAAGVLDAQVRVFQGDQLFEYAPDLATPGRYLPPSAPPQVEPLTEYRLEVEVEGKTVRASTTTPERVRVQQAVLLDEDTQEIVQTLKSFAEVGDGVYTAPENQITYLDGLLEFHLNNVAVAGYQAAIFALDEDLQFADEDWGDFADEEDSETSRANQSPPLAVSDGIVRWPWFAVAFTGRSLIKVYALDHNWFEYARSSPDQQEQGGFGGLAGDNFERPFFQVEGGIGLFGSASVDSVGFVVLPRP